MGYLCVRSAKVCLPLIELPAPCVAVSQENKFAAALVLALRNQLTALSPLSIPLTDGRQGTLHTKTSI